MVKQLLSGKKLFEWLNKETRVYATGKSYEGEILKLSVTGVSSLHFEVSHGGKVAYSGPSSNEALNTYNSLL